MTLLFSVFALLVHLASRHRHPSTVEYLGSIFLVILTSLFHEGLAAALVGVAFMTTILGITERMENSIQKPWLRLSASIGMPAAISFFTPGMWRRKEVMDTDDSSALEMLQEIPIAVMQFGNRNLVIIVVFVALILAVGAFGKQQASRRESSFELDHQ